MKKAFLYLIFPVLIIIFSLTSCIGVQSGITLNNDGAGSLDLVYRVSRMVADMGTYSGEKGVLPLPLAESDFRLQASRVPDIDLVSYSKKEDAKDITVQAKINFRTVAGLSAFFSSSGAAVSLSDRGGQTVYRQLLYAAENGPVDPETVSLVRELFSDYSFSVVFRAPKEISTASLGTISANRREAAYTAQIADMIASTEDIVWEIVW